MLFLQRGLCYEVKKREWETKKFSVIQLIKCEYLKFLIAEIKRNS